MSKGVPTGCRPLDTCLVAHLQQTAAGLQAAIADKLVAPAVCTCVWTDDTSSVLCCSGLRCSHRCVCATQSDYPPLTMPDDHSVKEFHFFGFDDFLRVRAGSPSSAMLQCLCQCFFNRVERVLLVLALCKQVANTSALAGRETSPSVEAATQFLSVPTMCAASPAELVEQLRTLRRVCSSAVQAGDKSRA